VILGRTFETIKGLKFLLELLYDFAVGMFGELLSTSIREAHDSNIGMITDNRDFPRSLH
jgi:hypothetical protein